MLHFEEKYKRFSSKKEAYSFYNSRILDSLKDLSVTRSDAGLASIAGVSRSFISLIRSGDKLIPYPVLRSWLNLVVDESCLIFIEMAYTDSMMLSIYLK